MAKKTKAKPRARKASRVRAHGNGRARARGEAPVDTGLSVPFDIADFSAITGVPCPCGVSRRAFMRDDNKVCSVHMVHISHDSRTHYHKGFTETYYFLDGEGHIELDGQFHPVKPGMAVMIRPGTRHRAVPGHGAMKILNIVVPPFNARDEWYD
jgi:mannose-6-phosphate isomerase-like protein (cupin superfamily)